MTESTERSSARRLMVETVQEVIEGNRGKPFSVEEQKALAVIVEETLFEDLDTLPGIAREVCEKHKHPRVAHLSAALRGRGQRDRRRAPTRAEADQRFALLARVKSFLREAGRLAHPGTKLRHLEFILKGRGKLQLTVCPAESDDDSWYVYYHDPGAWVPEGYAVGMDLRSCTLNQSCMAGAFWAGVVRGDPPVEVVLAEYQGIEKRARSRCEAMAAQGTLRGAP